MLKQLKQEEIYDEIRRLKESGSLPRLVSAGLLSPKASTYFDISERVSAKTIRLTRTSHKMIVSQVACEFRVSTSTIYRALNVMRKPLHTSATKIL